MTNKTVQDAAYEMVQWMHDNEPTREDKDAELADYFAAVIQRCVAKAVDERDQLIKSMEQTNEVLLKRLLELGDAVEKAHEKAAQGYAPPCYRILDKALAAYKKENGDD